MSRKGRFRYLGSVLLLLPTVNSTKIIGSQNGKTLKLPVNMAWDAFGEANGVRLLFETRQRMAYYRRTPILNLE
jgi:hypothetical protein